METITGRINDVFTHIKLFIGGGSVAERLDRWTWNPEAQCSSPSLTASSICSDNNDDNDDDNDDNDDDDDDNDCSPLWLMFV